MDDTPTLKTDNKMDALALTVAQAHVKWKEAYEDKETARKAVGLSGNLGAASVFGVRSQALIHVQELFQSSLKKLYFVAAKELNADLFPKRGETNYVKGLEAEKTLKGMLNAHIAEIAKLNGLTVPEENEYYQTKNVAAAAAG